MVLHSVVEPQENGWICPPTGFQISSWLGLVYFILMFYGVIVPALPPHSHTACYTIFSILVIAYIIFYIIVVSIDPGQYYGCSHPSQVQGFCAKCNITTSADVVHCSDCNKCVSGYDHHCDWLNNCIGSDNYRSFLGLISFASAAMGVFVICNSYIMFIFYLKDSGITLYDGNYIMFGHGVSSTFWIVLATGNTIFSFIVFSVFFYLVCLHVYLTFTDWTTHELITGRTTRPRQQTSRVVYVR